MLHREVEVGAQPLVGVDQKLGRVGESAASALANQQHAGSSDGEAKEGT